MVCGGRWRPAPGRYEYRAGKCSRTPGRHPAVELKKPGKLAGLLRFQRTEAVEGLRVPLAIRRPSSARVANRFPALACGDGAGAASLRNSASTYTSVGLATQPLHS